MYFCNKKLALKNILSSFLVFSLILNVFAFNVKASENEVIGIKDIKDLLINSDISENEMEEFRAVWVGTVFGLNYPSKATTDDTALKKDAIEILDYVKDMGFNTVIFQVRPSCDALYKSNIFPWSKYLTGQQGLAPANNFDPLAFFVEEAHARGLKLHAWINPYRVTATKNDESSLCASNPAILRKEITVKHTDGKVYWNPGEPDARQIVLDGIKEIVNNYDVDGIHIDDYFYPEGNFNDSFVYNYYGNGLSLADWRRENNNKLVKSIYEIVHSSEKNIEFGVSPSGIWANKSYQTPQGSNTNGSESYSVQFADSRKWVKEGYIDYIIPQIYWNIGFDKADYKELVSWWADLVKDTNVKLYIGQAAYKTGNKNINSPWYGVNEIQRQIELNRQNELISGYAMYSYSSLKNEALYNLVKQINNYQNSLAAQN